MKILDTMYDIVLLEYCPGEMSDFLEWYMYEIKSIKKNSKMVINNFIYELSRKLFKIIFKINCFYKF